MIFLLERAFVVLAFGTLLLMSINALIKFFKGNKEDEKTD
jgi:hypothetical protein